MKLVRLKDDGVSCLGMLDGRWWTIERPWLDNQLRISCIPVDMYEVKRHVSPSKGLCWSVEDVIGRTHILIHVANWSHELMGCIAPGLNINSSESMVASSRKALNEMLDTLPDQWELEIVNAF